MTESQIPLLLAELQDMIMGSVLAKCAITDLGIQWAGWALAAAFKTEKFYDLAGNLKTRFLNSNLRPCTDYFCSFACLPVNCN